MTDLSSLALWALVLLPALAGGALALSEGLAGRAGRGRAATVTSLSVSATTVLLAIVVARGRPAVTAPFMAGSHLGLRVDGLAALMVPTIAVITLLVLLAAPAEIRHGRARFHGLMLVFASSALLTALSTTLVGLLLAWEVMGATSYALIGFEWRQERRVASGLTAFVTTRTADLGLYAAAGAALAAGAGLDLDALPAGSPGWRSVVALGVLVAALGKAAQLPFSFWISRAMDGPSPVSALLHSAAMVAMGAFLLLRTQPLLAATGWAATTAAWVGALTALLLGMVALAQRDVKQLLAASTSAQLGFVVLAAGVGAVGDGSAQLVAHAATKALLFLCAGVWLVALGTHHLDGLRGAVRRWPALGSLAVIGLLTLAGLPPLSLWATKDAVLAATLEVSPWLYAVGLAAAVASAGYAGKALWLLWRPAGREETPDLERHRDEEQHGSGRVTRGQLLPLLPLAVGAATLGVLALPPVSGDLADLVGTPGGVSPTPAELVASGLLALAAIGVVARRRPPEPGWAQHWLGLQVLTQATLVRPSLRLADALARFDDRVLARAVDAAAASALALARRARRTDDRVHGAVRGLATGVRRGAALARRPQTGQLHQYYLQAVVLVAAGAAGAVLIVLVR